MKATVKPNCKSCNAYEDRLEEIRMAVTLDQPAKNPYGQTTIEYQIWELRQTIENLRKQNRHDRKQWKNEVREQKTLRRTALKLVKAYDNEPKEPSKFISNGDKLNAHLAQLVKLARKLTPNH